MDSPHEKTTVKPLRAAPTSCEWPTPISNYQSKIFSIVFILEGLPCMYQYIRMGIKVGQKLITDLRIGRNTCKLVSSDFGSSKFQRFLRGTCPWNPLRVYKLLPLALVELMLCGSQPEQQKICSVVKLRITAGFMNNVLCICYRSKLNSG